jgi:hypothetical protein
VQEDDAVGEGFGGEELEAEGAMARLDQRNAFANQDGDDVDAELVDFAGVQERGDDFAAAHHPDIFAGLGAQALGEWFDGLVDEFEGGQGRFTRVAGKDVVLDFRAEAGGLHTLLHAHLEALGVRLVAPEDSVDGFEEGGIAIVAFGARAVEPGDVAVGTRDEAVGAGGDEDDDFSGSLTFSGILHFSESLHGGLRLLGDCNAAGAGGHLLGCTGEESKEKRDSSHPQADRVVPQNRPGPKRRAGATREEKSRPAPFGMTGA